jgi:hypothetical protein
MASVPFSIRRLYGGLGRCHGVLHDEGDNFRFEFQVKDSFAGLLKTDVKEIRIPVKEIDSVQLLRKWWGTSRRGVRIVLHAIGLATFKDIPGASHRQLVLNVARRDVDMAQAFVDGLYTQETENY